MSKKILTLNRKSHRLTIEDDESNSAYISIADISGLKQDPYDPEWYIIQGEKKYVGSISDVKEIREVWSWC